MRRKENQELNCGASIEFFKNGVSFRDACLLYNGTICLSFCLYIKWTTNIGTSLELPSSRVLTIKYKHTYFNFFFFVHVDLKQPLQWKINRRLTCHTNMGTRWSREQEPPTTLFLPQPPIIPKYKLKITGGYV